MRLQELGLQEAGGSGEQRTTGLAVQTTRWPVQALLWTRKAVARPQRVRAQSKTQPRPPASAGCPPSPLPREFPEPGREQWEEMQEEMPAPPLPAQAPPGEWPSDRGQQDCLSFPPLNILLNQEIPLLPRLRWGQSLHSPYSAGRKDQRQAACP